VLEIVRIAHARARARATYNATYKTFQGASRIRLGEISSLVSLASATLLVSRSRDHICLCTHPSSSPRRRRYPPATGSQGSSQSRDAGAALSRTLVRTEIHFLSSDDPRDTRVRFTFVGARDRGPTGVPRGMASIVQSQGTAASKFKRVT